MAESITSCEAFFRKRALLIKEGKDPKQATAIAASMMRDSGGSPSKCVGKKD